jgi:hypothetical protein
MEGIIKNVPERSQTDNNYNPIVHCYVYSPAFAAGLRISAQATAGRDGRGASIVFNNTCINIF